MCCVRIRTLLRLCVAQVHATDCDTGRNSEIEYSLVGEQRARRYASIDVRTGALRLLRDLDFEQTLEQSLVLHILARDSPSVGPRLSATATLTVNVCSYSKPSLSQYS